MIKRIKYFVGVNEPEQRVKYTTEKDCLSPDITEYGEAELTDIELVNNIKGWQKAGYKIEIE